MSINLKIISSKTGEVFREKCRSILFTSQGGEVEVLEGHIPLIANIAENTSVIITCENEEKMAFFTPSNGFFTLNHNDCLITLVSCEKRELEQKSNYTKVKKAS